MIGSLVTTILIGALSGYIAGLIMKVKGGFWFNCVLGIVGSFIGIFLAGLIGISTARVSIGGVLLSVVGACLLIWLVRKIGSKA
ncbi:MAG: GlsB/YeaQ/YmgE family stress response membrane protein [Butyricicoccus sp.]|nr:GlsB/YeaQ/YmgE family stress response membrane protein [Butyricicoccus sp.]